MLFSSLSRLDCVLDPSGDTGGLFISGWDSATKEKNLADNKITAVVSAIPIELAKHASFQKLGIKQEIVNAQDF